MNRPLDPLDLLDRSGLDLSTPFTTPTARAAGLESRHLLRLVDLGLLCRPLRGVYHGAHLEDSLDLRVECVRLVVPEDAVVTDRTAGWLHGSAMALAPNDHLAVPVVSVFQGPGKRLRNDVTVSGERRLADRDVVEIHGVRVTTPLRTACDLGRLLRRDGAFAALDAMARLGRFTLDELVAEVERFRGYRGVRQLRAFAPLTDPGAESFGGVGAATEVVRRGELPTAGDADPRPPAGAESDGQARSRVQRLAVRGRVRRRRLSRPRPGGPRPDPTSLDRRGRVDGGRVPSSRRLRPPAECLRKACPGTAGCRAADPACSMTDTRTFTTGRRRARALSRRVGGDE